MYRFVLITITALLSSFRILPDTDTDKFVINAAEGQLPVWLSKLTRENAPQYGFTEDDDLDDCTIGKPYRILVFSRDFYENEFDENQNYLDIKNEWRAPVMIKDQSRCMLTVGGAPGNLIVSGMGDTMLAKLLLIKSKGVTENSTFYLLRVPLLHLDFFAYEGENTLNEARFVPLIAMTDSITAVNKNIKSSYTLTELETFIKKSLTPPAADTAIKKEPTPDKPKKTPTKKPAK